MNMLKDIKTKPEFPFYVKLQEWYGNRINGKKFDILHTYENDGELNTVIFMMEIDNQIEIARIFYLGDKLEISIDCQADVSTMQGVRKLIKYGGFYNQYEIE